MCAHSKPALRWYPCATLSLPVVHSAEEEGDLLGETLGVVYIWQSTNTRRPSLAEKTEDPEMPPAVVSGLLGNQVPIVFDGQASKPVACLAGAEL